MNRISVIIPAFNEADNVGQVLGLLAQVKEIDEIIVVDDGSSDGTGVVARMVSGVKVVSLKTNIGKSGAVLAGVKLSRFENILFFDADLKGMKKVYVRRLIERYRQGFDMVIMDKGAQPWFFRGLLQSAPALSGVRILRKSDFMKVGIGEDDGFELEIKINDYYLKEGMKIGVTGARTVWDPRKYKKYPFIKGLYLDVKSGLEILTAKGLWLIPNLLEDFRRIRESG